MSNSQRMNAGRIGLAGVWLGMAALLCGCRPDASEPGPTVTENGALDDAEPARLSFGERRARRERGRQLYLAECSGCHGERGRGDGPAAEAVDSKPRDFVSERFKFRRTAFTDPPLLADIVDTIELGMPGSSMPPFHFLDVEDRTLIGEYVLYMAGIDPEKPAEELLLPAETSATADSLARGRKVYERLECFMCHGEEGHGDGPSSATLVDERDRKIEARDFRLGLFRRGRTPAELYRTFETGIAGTPMPSYSGLYTPEEGWDLARFVLSLMGGPAPPPSDPLARGRHVVEDRQCFACHVIEGRGGRVGPSLDVSSHKLLFPWIERFLDDPREFGKIYPFTPYRMPDLGLSPEEIDGVLTLLAHVSERTYPEPVAPRPEIDAEHASQGVLFYVIKCAECHNLGDVISTPMAKQQGPDLIHAAERLRFDWIPEWVANPLDVYPGTAMVDTNLTEQEIDVVRAFLWQTSLGAIGN